MIEYDKSGHLYGNFMHYEVARSYTAQRLGIDNTPPPEAMEAAKQLAMYCLQPIRDHYGIAYSPSSWYRGEKLERKLTDKSYRKWAKQHGITKLTPGTWRDYFNRKSHPKGEAADIELVGVSNDALFNWCKTELEYDQLIREFAKAGEPSSGWVHISWRQSGNRMQAFTIG